VADVEKAYWDLVAARRDLDVRRGSLALAEQQRYDTWSRRVPHQRSRSPATTHFFCGRAVVRCSALFGSVRCLWADRLGRVKLQQLNRCSIVKYERNTNSNRWLGRCDQNLPTFEGFVQIVDGKGDVRNNFDDLGHVAMRLEPDPLDPVGTGLKTGDMNPEVRDMMLPSTRLCVWNPDMVVPPSELRCHGRRLMVQSLSARHGSLHRSYSPIAIIWPVKSAERAASDTMQVRRARVMAATLLNV
jgi:hypothetical protein